MGSSWIQELYECGKFCISLDQPTGPQSLNAPEKLAHFWRQYNNGSASPLAIGPLSSNGCKPFAKLLKGLNMYGLTKGCATPVVSLEKETYGNIVRLNTPGENMANGMVKFVKEQGWNSLALVGTTEPLDYDMATLIHKGASQLNISVPWFEVLPYNSINTDHSLKILMNLKQSTNRIIATAIVKWYLFFDFLCQAHKAGIKGPRYVFVAMSYSYININNLPDSRVNQHCERGILKAQLKQTVYVGAKLIIGSLRLENTDMISSLGHTRESFDLEYSEFSRNIGFEPEKEKDYPLRFECYDIAMTIVMVLNRTETKLQKSNLTISDFLQQPQEVSREIHNSFRNLEFTGLFNDHHVISDRLEMDDGTLYAFMPQDPDYDFKSKMLAGSDVFDPNTYSYEEMNPIDWENGKPHDVARTVVTLKSVDKAVLYFVIACSASLAIVQIVTFGYLYKKDMPLRKISYLVACILLDVLAVAYGVGTIQGGKIESNLIICEFRLVVLIMALSLLHGLNVNRMRNLVQKNRGVKARNKTRGFSTMKSNKSSKSNFRNSTSNRNGNENISVQVSYRDAVETKLAELKTIGLIFLLVTCFLIICLLADPLTFSIKTHDPVIDLATDTVVTEIEGICTSENFIIWVIVAASIHAICLLIGVFYAYNLRLASKSSNIEQIIPDLKMIRILQVIYMSLFAATFLLLVIFNDSANQASIIAIVCLLESLATYILVGRK